MTNREQGKSQLQQRAKTGAPAAQDPAKTIDGLIKRMLPQIKRALPEHLNPDALARICLTTIRQNPQLLECSQESLLGAVMQSAQLGLKPDMLGQAYFVPFNDKKTGMKQVQFIIGYRGYLELIRRTGEIESIQAREVYENDEFDFEYGLEERLKHKPVMLGERGKVIAYYVVAKYKDGGYNFAVSSKIDIEEFAKNNSKSYNRQYNKFYGPWATHFDEMAKKTMIRSLIKYLPISVEVMDKIDRTDETVRKKVDSDPEHIEGDIIGSFEPQDEPDQEEAAQDGTTGAPSDDKGPSDSDIPE